MSTKEQIAAKYLKAKTATDKCLGGLALVRKKKREIAKNLLQKSDRRKIVKISQEIKNL